MLKGTFAALQVRNYRLYFGGQSVSLVGTWMQSVAQTWLVLQLSHSGTMLGLAAAAQFLPVLLFASYGGLIADRSDKRRLLIITQTLLGLLALTLGLLTITHVVRLWTVFVLAGFLGCINALDVPARQAFAMELSGPDLVRNAVTLNSVMVNSARAVGPSLAGILIATLGVGVCFLANAVSYAGALTALACIDRARLHRTAPATRRPGQLREGMRYVGRTPSLLIPLLMMALIGTLAYEFQVVLPLMARDTLRGDAAAYGFMTSAIGVGAIVGGLVIASRSTTGLRSLSRASGGLGLALAAAAVAPSLAIEMAALVLVGVSSTGFLSVGSSTLQLRSDPQYRGRVMALWSVAFLGSTPVGGPTVGWVAERFSPRAALGLGALACVAATVLGTVAVVRRTAAGAAAVQP